MRPSRAQDWPLRPRRSLWGCRTKEETPRWRRGEGRRRQRRGCRWASSRNAPVLSGNIFFHLLLINTVYTLGPTRSQMRPHRPRAAGTAAAPGRARRAQPGPATRSVLGTGPEGGRVDPVGLASPVASAGLLQRALRPRVRDRRGCVSSPICLECWHRGRPTGTRVSWGLLSRLPGRARGAAFAARTVPSA